MYESQFFREIDSLTYHAGCTVNCGFQTVGNILQQFTVQVILNLHTMLIYVLFMN